MYIVYLKSAIEGKKVFEAQMVSYDHTFLHATLEDGLALVVPLTMLRGYVKHDKSVKLDQEQGAKRDPEAYNKIVAKLRDLPKSPEVMVEAPEEP